jgi:hypothetical protein
VVHADHRRKGIARELLKHRKVSICVVKRRTDVPESKSRELVKMEHE